MVFTENETCPPLLEQIGISRKLDNYIKTFYRVLICENIHVYFYSYEGYRHAVTAGYSWEAVYIADADKQFI